MYVRFRNNLKLFLHLYKSINGVKKNLYFSRQNVFFDIYCVYAICTICAELFATNKNWRCHLKIIIENSSPDSIYEQIAQQIKAQIINNELDAGDPLPSIRKLASELHISVITTKRAYEELDKGGFIDTVSGKGCFVAFHYSNQIN